MEMPLTNLPVGKEAKMIRLRGGQAFQRKLMLMGIKKGETIKVLAIQPFGGPVVIEIKGKQTTLGRGMANNIFVEAEK